MLPAATGAAAAADDAATHRAADGAECAAVDDFDRDGWRTPLYVFLFCRLHWPFDADAAATAANRLCEVYFEDGLETPWHARAHWVWCNPPYSNLYAWLGKAAEESYRGCGSVLLVPSHKGDTWWRDFVVGRASRVVLLTGRILFLHPERDETCRQAPFGSSLVVFEPNPDRRPVTTVLQEFSIPLMKRRFGPPRAVLRLRELGKAGR